MLTSCGVVDSTSRPRQHGVRMSLFKSFKIQRMQVFRPEIEPYFFFVTVLQKFRPESNLSQAYRTFLTVNSLEEFHWRTTTETSAKARVLISP